MARQSRQSNPLWVRAISKPTVDTDTNRITCECGRTYREGFFAQHRVSETHRQFVWASALREDRFESRVQTQARTERIQADLDDIRIIWDITSRQPLNVVFDINTRVPSVLIPEPVRTRPRRVRLG